MSASLKGTFLLLACTLALTAAAAPQHNPPPRPVPPPHRPATTPRVQPPPPATAPAHIAATQSAEAEERPLLIPPDPTEALAAAREARSDRPADAYRIYKHLVKTSPLSDEGKAAATESAAMEKDEAVVKKVMASHAEAKASAALDMADNFRANGLPDKAKQRYEKVIAEFPDSMCASVAKERLTKAATSQPTATAAQPH